MGVRYRLGVSGFVAERGNRHDWAWLAAFPVRHFELSTLYAGEELAEALGRLRPASFGVHWPLRAPSAPAAGLAEPLLLQSSRAAFHSELQAIHAALRGSGAAYVLVHFPQRGEAWPDPPELEARLELLAGLATELGLEVLLEPKERLIAPGGLSGFVQRVPLLPPGVALCLDTSDWRTAAHHLGCGPEPLAGRAAAFHLHSMHVRPESGGHYLHAPPWVEPGPEPAWPEVLQPEPGELQLQAARERVVTVQVELDPRYAARLPDSLRAVRRRLGALGWVEEA